MKAQELLYPPTIGYPVREADAAILFVPEKEDDQFNERLLFYYENGYAQTISRKVDLHRGYFLVEQQTRKSLLLVVRAGLQKYFKEAILGNRRELAGKRILVELPSLGEELLLNTYRFVNTVVISLMESRDDAGIAFAFSLPDTPESVEVVKRVLQLSQVADAGTAAGGGKRPEKGASAGRKKPGKPRAKEVAEGSGSPNEVPKKKRPSPVESSEKPPASDQQPPSTSSLKGTINLFGNGVGFWTSDAGLVSDAEDNPDPVTGKSVDQLDIRKDVFAFARVIAARSFQPPLAIALFGEWGSGKSFFMRKLEQRIEYLTDHNGLDAYCEGIVQIRFNAWSYLDANLWASLMSRIFEGLYAYIHENVKAGEVENLGLQLNKQLNISRMEMANLEQKKGSINDNIQALENRRAQLGKNIGEKIGAIRKKTAVEVVKEADENFHVREKIEDALRENKSLAMTIEEVKKVVPEKYWDNPSAAYAEVRSRYAFLREFTKRDKIGRNLLVSGSIIILILLLPLGVRLFTTKLQAIDFFLPQTVLSVLVAGGSVWRRVSETYRKLQPIAASFWKIKEDYERKMQEALARFEQEEKALKLEIEANKSELVLVEGQIQQQKALQTQLDFKLNNALNTDALYSFIERRFQSDDYKKHLGILSTIRKDFEMLSYLFAGHNAEVTKIAKVAALKEQFELHFNRHLERVVLYIDDLDRCAPENVVQVLEAVNLLMAFPLFVVVVGVDPAWIKKALITQHHAQFAGLPAGMAGSAGVPEPIDPMRYLEKIFQVPFYLKSATNEEVQGMLSMLAQSKPIARKAPFGVETGRKKGNGTESGTEADPNKIEDSDPVRSSVYGSDPDRQPALTNGVEPDQQRMSTDGIDPGQQQRSISDADPQPEKLPDPDDPESWPEKKILALNISDDEIGLIKDMSVVLGSNPRALKRFVNSYRIIRCHEDFKVEAGPNGILELAGVLFMLALAIGRFKSIYQEFESYLESPNSVDKKFGDYIEYDSSTDGRKIQLHFLLIDTPSYKLLKEVPVRVMEGQKDFVGRFIFRSLG